MKAPTIIHTSIALLLALAASLGTQELSAQDYDAKQRLRAGNESYTAGDYDKALQAYQEASTADSTYAKAAYNLANAMYQEGKIDEAMGLYNEAAELFSDNKDRARTHHNIGRTQLEVGLRKIQAMAANGGQPADETQDPRPHLETALKEFKQTLLLDSEDAEARYNYSYTRKLLSTLPPSDEEQQEEEKQEQEQEEQDKEDQEKKDEEKKDEGSEGDEKDEQEKEDGEGEKDEEPKDKEDKGDQEKDQPDKGDKNEKGDKENQQPEPQAQDPNRMNAEQQLDLLDQAEKELQKAMAKKRMQGNPIKVEKDW